MIYFIIDLILTICFRCAYSCSKKKNLITDETYVKKYSSNGMAFLTFGYIIYIIFSVFRVINKDVGGIDAIQYLRIFELADKHSLISYFIIRKEEKGFLFILWIIRKFTDNFKVVLFVFHTLTYVSFAIGFRNMRIEKENIASFLMTFFILCNLFSMFNVLRMGIVIALSMLFFKKLLNDEFGSSLLILITMILFHLSSIILFFVWFTLLIRKRYKLSYSKIFVIFLFLFCFVSLAITVLSAFINNGVYGYYSDKQGLAIGTYASIGLTLFMVFIIKRNKNDPEIMKNQIVLLFSLLCIPIQLSYSIAYRMILPFLPLLSYDLLLLYNKNKLRKGINCDCYNIAIRIFVIALLIYRCIDTFKVTFVSDGLYPYKFLLKF